MRRKPRRKPVSRIALSPARFGTAIATGALATGLALVAVPSSSAAPVAGGPSVNQLLEGGVQVKAGELGGLLAGSGAGPQAPAVVAETAAANVRARERAAAQFTKDKQPLTIDQEKAMTRLAVQKARHAAATRVTERDLKVVGVGYPTATLKLRTEPNRSAKTAGLIRSGKKVKVTAKVHKDYRLVVVEGKGRWVTKSYLSKKRPKSGAGAGISAAHCSKSSGIESGLVSNGRKVYRAMCAAFPQVSSFGGRRAGGGFHGTGQAVDAMISDSAAGWRMARWVRSNASRLGVSEVIYSQKIWTVQRSGEGWRSMSDRGSATANHYDHVHVSVY